MEHLLELKNKCQNDCRSAQRQDLQNNRTANKCVLPQQLIKTHCVMTFKNSEVHFGCDVSLRRLRSWVKVSFLARCHIKGRGLKVPTTSHYKRHSWGRGRSLSSLGSSCTAKMWIWRCPFTKRKEKMTKKNEEKFRKNMRKQRGLKRVYPETGPNIVFFLTRNVIRNREAIEANVFGIAAPRPKNTSNYISNVCWGGCGVRSNEKTTSPHKWLKFRCLTLPSPCLPMMPIVAFASTCNSITPTSTPGSRPMLSVYRSASQELKAMTL